MTVPRQKKASETSDAPSRKHSRSDAYASDASDQINNIFGSVGSRTRSRSRSSSASAHTLKRALDQQLDGIALKKERNAKQDARVMNMSRTEQKLLEGSACVKEVLTASNTQDDHVPPSAYGDGMPAELRLMFEGDSQASQLASTPLSPGHSVGAPGTTRQGIGKQTMLESASGTQDPAMADAMGSAELPGSQLTVRSSSQISQGSHDVSTPEELRGMLGPRPVSYTHLTLPTILLV